MSTVTTDVINIMLAIILLFLNGFFVAAEFSLVKIRPSRLDEQVEKNQRFAATARWLAQRMDASLSACQLGITMASLGLGWIGEPAIAHLLRPLLQAAGVVSEIWIHGIAFAVAFTSITAAHLVFGEQAPKIYALRRPETILLWFALPLKFFYFVSYPFMIALNATTSFLLKKIGVKGVSEHDAVHSEDEFDSKPLEIKSDGPGRFIVPGGTDIAAVNRQLNLQLDSIEAETLSGLLTEKTGQVLSVGDRIKLDGAVAEV